MKEISEYKTIYCLFSGGYHSTTTALQLKDYGFDNVVLVHNRTYLEAKYTLELIQKIIYMTDYPYILVEPNTKNMRVGEIFRKSLEKIPEIVEYFIQDKQNYRDLIPCCKLLKKSPSRIFYTKEIDAYPDYSLYGVDFAMGYISKGCTRTCEFCIVPEMEGTIHKFADLEEFRKDQKKVMLLDNNILAYKNHVDELKKLIASEIKVDFNQGLDIRLINKKNARLLSKIPRWKGLRLRFAFDHPDLKKIIEKKLIILNDAGISNGAIQFYLLIGFNTTHQGNLMRLRFLRKKGIAAFVMPYNKMDPYQKNFTRWVNRYFYKYQSFQDYLSEHDQIKILTALR